MSLCNAINKNVPNTQRTQVQHNELHHKLLNNHYEPPQISHESTRKPCNIHYSTQRYVLFQINIYLHYYCAQFQHDYITASGLNGRVFIRNLVVTPISLCSVFSVALFLHRTPEDGVSVLKHGHLTDSSGPTGRDSRDSRVETG